MVVLSLYVPTSILNQLFDFSHTYIISTLYAAAVYKIIVSQSSSILVGHIYCIYICYRVTKYFVYMADQI